MMKNFIQKLDSALLLEANYKWSSMNIDRMQKKLKVLGRNSDANASDSCAKKIILELS